MKKQRNKNTEKINAKADSSQIKATQIYNAEEICEKASREEDTPKITKRRIISDGFYIFAAFLIFFAITAAMLVLPRSTVSQLEKRKLAEFPKLNVQSYFSGEYTAQLSSYFSDTVPLRDKLTAISTAISNKKGISTGVKLHGVTAKVDSAANQSQTAEKTPDKTAKDGDAVAETVTETVTETTTEAGNKEIEAVDLGTNDDKNTIVNNGIAIVGTRALMLYGGNFACGERYAQVINKYKETLGKDVNVYSMVIPTACEFYATADLQPYIASQLENINHIISFLSDDVKSVDVYTTLAQHRNEDIYLRTDHHWSDLGAYYAAKEFAAAAGVDFADLSEYEKNINPGYVGTMYAFSGDMTIKNNPEDFVYYVPKKQNYTTTYYEYTAADGEITGTLPPYEGHFFMTYPEGSGEAYSTFMGGDQKVVHVHSDAANGRRLAILKDSYGNALPGYLINSFEDIYVIDMRYFKYNLPSFVKNKGITDLLFANNVFHAATESTITYYDEFLTQPDTHIW